MAVKILWVDDDGPRRFEHEIFRLERELSAEVDFAMTITGAINKLKENKYDYVLLDQMLPPDNAAQAGDLRGGLNILKALCSRHSSRDFATSSRVPVTILSAFYAHDVYERIKAIRRDVAILEKPVDIESLLELVSGALDRTPESETAPDENPASVPEND